MSMEQVRQIVDAYPLTDHDVLAKIHPLKPVRQDIPPNARIMRLYTDGSCLKDSENPVRSTYSGWGFCLKEFKEGGAKIVRNQYGHILDGTPLMGELEAVRQGLLFIDRPSAVSIVTDSLHAIQLLIDQESVHAEFDKLQAKGKGGCTRARELRVAMDVHRLLQNENVVASEISWVRAHQIDKVPLHERPPVSDAETYDDKMLLMDLYGNEQADIQAKNGAKKAVRSALKKLHHVEKRVLREIAEIDRIECASSKTQEQKNREVHELKGSTEWRAYEKAARQFSRNINSNFSAKKEAIVCMAQNPPGFLTRFTQNMFFSEQDYKAVKDEKFAEKEKHQRRFVDYGASMNKTEGSESLPKNNSFCHKTRPAHGHTTTDLGIPD